MKRSFREIKFRLALASALFLLMFLAVGVRAIQLQIFEGEKLKRLGERQHLKEWVLLPKRGTILDRAGEPLALSLEAQSVYARPRRLKEPETVARSLAQALTLDLAEVQQKLRTEKPFVWLKRQITPREAEKVKALNLDGVGMLYEPNRYYPQGQL
ncbi:MAG: penicillin-binding protein, partial [Candidatus Binatia bacterium]